MKTLRFIIPLAVVFVSVNSMQAQATEEEQEVYKEILDAFFEMNFERCYDYEYKGIASITKVKKLATGETIVEGKVINGGNWGGEVVRKFNATIRPISGNYKLQITVSKQGTGEGVVMKWIECSGTLEL